MSVDLLLISDGRDAYLQRCLISMVEHMAGVNRVVHVDDADHRLGFDGAIREGWRRLADSDAEYVLHVEQDFVFTRHVSLSWVAMTMTAHPHLAQMALLRQPWSRQERAVGGIVQMDPGAYAARSWLGAQWLEHRKWFTTNPCLYRRALIERGWPDAPDSERKFSEALFADPDVRCAYWGTGEVWVEHIGHERVGTGY